MTSTPAHATRKPYPKTRKPAGKLAHSKHDQHDLRTPETIQTIAAIANLQSLPPIPGPKGWTDDLEQAWIYRAACGTPPKEAGMSLGFGGRVPRRVVGRADLDSVEAGAQC